MVQKWFISIILTLTGLVHTPIFAQKLSLDDLFGQNGKVSTDFIGLDDRAYSIALQRDNKILLAGWSHNGSDYDFAVVRYNDNGILDTTFSSDGRLTLDFNGNNDRIYSISVLNSTRILVAGYCGDMNGISDFCLACFDQNGNLDHTFGNSGTVVTRINNNNSRGYTLQIQDDGKILVAGQGYFGPNGDFAIVRYNKEGHIDSTFNAVGIQIIDFDAWNDQALAMAIGTDGKILVSGTSLNKIVLTRLNNNGTMDSSFALNGKLVIDNGAGSGLKNALAIQQDGKILIAGTYNGDVMLIRCSENGSVDSSFQSNGLAVVDYGQSLDKGSSISIQNDGKIIVTGKTYVNGDYSDFALLRFNKDGSLDSTSSADGKISTEFNGYNDWGYANIIQSDGKILVAGESATGNNYDFALARYKNEGSLNSVVHKNPDAVAMTFFPNPFSSNATVRIRFQNLIDEEKIEFSICNTLGKTIQIPMTIHNINDYELQVELNRGTLPSGVYFFQIRSNTRLLYNGKMIIN